MNMPKDASSRRSFLKTASVAATAITIVPRHVLGQGQTPPSQKLNIAAIGVGGMGSGDVDSCGQIVVLGIFFAWNGWAASPQQNFLEHPKHCAAASTQSLAKSEPGNNVLIGWF